MPTAAANRSNKSSKENTQMATVNSSNSAGLLIFKAVGRIQNPSFISHIAPSQVLLVSKPTVRIPVTSTEPFLVDTEISLVVNFVMYLTDSEAEPVPVGTIENQVTVRNDEQLMQSAPVQAMSPEMKEKTLKRCTIILRALRRSDELASRPELISLQQSAGEDASSIINTMNDEDRMNMEMSSARLTKSIKPTAIQFDTIAEFEQYMENNLNDEEKRVYETTFQGMISDFTLNYIQSI